MAVAPLGSGAAQGPAEGGRAHTGWQRNALRDGLEGTGRQVSWGQRSREAEEQGLPGDGCCW